MLHEYDFDAKVKKIKASSKGFLLASYFITGKPQGISKLGLTTRLEQTIPSARTSPRFVSEDPSPIV